MASSVMEIAMNGPPSSQSVGANKELSTVPYRFSTLTTTTRDHSIKGLISYRGTYRNPR